MMIIQCDWGSPLASWLLWGSNCPDPTIVFPPWGKIVSLTKTKTKSCGSYHHYDILTLCYMPISRVYNARPNRSSCWSWCCCRCCRSGLTNQHLEMTKVCSTLDVDIKIHKERPLSLFNCSGVLWWWGHYEAIEGMPHTSTPPRTINPEPRPPPNL